MCFGSDLTSQITETKLQTQHDAETHQKKMQALAEEKENSSAALQQCTACVHLCASLQKCMHGMHRLSETIARVMPARLVTPLSCADPTLKTAKSLPISAERLLSPTVRKFVVLSVHFTT